MEVVYETCCGIDVLLFTSNNFNYVKIVYHPLIETLKELRLKLNVF